MQRTLVLLLALMMLLSVGFSALAEQGEHWIAEREIVGRAFNDDIGSTLQDNQKESSIVKYIQEQTGVTFTWEFTSGNDDLEVLTTMLAVGDIPDVILSYCDNSGRPEFNVLRQAIQAGMFLDLTPYLENTKVLKNYLDDSWLPKDTAENVIRNSEYPDDGIYMLHMRIERYPSARGRDDLALYMNMDVAKAAGIDPTDITTTESLIAAAERIKALNLSDRNGQPVMPIGTSVWGGRMQAEYFLSAAISTGRESLFGVVDGKVVHVSGTDLLKQQISYVREMLDKGLIDSEVFTMASARSQENAVNGHYAFMIMNAGQANNRYFNTGIEWLPCYNLTDRNGSRALNIQYKSGYNIVAVNADVKNPQEVVDFIDYMASRDGKLAWNYGIEGVHFDFNENGIPVIRPEWTELSKSNATLAMEEGIMALGSQWGLIGNTDMAPFDDFGEYTIGDSQSAEKVAHKAYIQGYGDPEISYYDGVSASSYLYRMSESAQIKLEQFVTPSYHNDIFIKACFADSDEEVDKILADYRNLLERQGIEEFETLLQNAYETEPDSIHFY